MPGRVNNCWGMDMKEPLPGREERTATEGLTMVLDKGLGTESLRDMLEIAGDYMDFLKLSFGTSFLYPEDILDKKIELAEEAGIDIYPGGTLFEIAVFRSRMKEYLFRVKKLGFSAIEISSGTMEIGPKVKNDAIRKAKSLGLKVLTEVGKKSRRETLVSDEFIERITRDEQAGADYIIVEGRESGRGISIYDREGSIKLQKFSRIADKLKECRKKIIWEAPLKKQQVFFIRNLGQSVNLGNIAPEEVVALEALRRGLRGDTFRDCLNKQQGEIV
ncbi:MAG: phosphosulfolactate synthase [Halanaerobiales bacterium]